MSDDIDSDRRRYAERALACLDLTSLNLDDTPEVIDVLCGRALSPAPGGRQENARATPERLGVEGLRYGAAPAAVCLRD